MSAFIQITVGGEAGPTSFRLEANAAPEELDKTLDQMLRAIGRQKNKLTMGQRILDLREAKLFLQSWPQPKVDLGKERVVEYNKHIEGMKEQHKRANKRLEWKPNPQQEQWIFTFHKQTEILMQEKEAEREAKKKAIPLMEKEIERWRRIINGEDGLEDVDRETALIEMSAAAD